MRGHQQSAVRKLNRHWQSSSRGNWLPIPPYALAVSPASGVCFNDPMVIQNSFVLAERLPQNFDKPSSSLLKFAMYAVLKRFDNPQIIDIGIEDYSASHPGTSPGNSAYLTLFYYDNSSWTEVRLSPFITSPVVSQYYSYYPFDNISNFAVKNNLYLTSDFSMANPLSRNCLSKDKNNPSVFEFDVLSHFPTATKYYVKINATLTKASVLTSSFPSGVKFTSQLREDRSEVEIDMGLI